ncbi:MAG: Lrp/AsnC ligand binding domain-containing protein [Bacteroidaceae bacterium]|nr:Lrp/AsnC ligand binding domain-containing protein [Bacteroidaceae bacterium]
MSHTTIDQLDEKILNLIAADARKPFLEVARLCNVSGAAIHQRIQRLFKIGVLKGSQFVLSPSKIGYDTCAFVGIYLKEPSDFDRVMAGLREIPEVVECHVTTGGYDIFVKLYARNNAHMMEIIKNKLRPLGLQRTDSIISFQEAFTRQMPIPALNAEDE